VLAGREVRHQILGKEGEGVRRFFPETYEGSSSIEETKGRGEFSFTVRLIKWRESTSKRRKEIATPSS